MGLSNTTYKVPAIGNTETQLEIEVTPEENFSVRSAYRSMKKYKLHDNVTFEHLLHVIASQKLGRDIVVSDTIWDNLISVNASYIVKKNGVDVRQMESKEVSDYYTAPEGRTNQIRSYSQEMDESWQKPVFLHSSVFDGLELKLKLNGNSVFILDGARRIVAGCISDKIFTEATIIMTSEYFGKELINLEDVDPGKLVWFPNYQKLPEAGIDGWRSNARYKYIDMSNIRDKTIIDFGCNLGQTCIKVGIAGAKHVYGLDCQQDTLELANRIISGMGIRNISYHVIDFNHPEFARQIDKIVEMHSDISFFLSVYRTGELIQRDALFRYIIEKTSGEIFFEGHANSEIDTLAYYDDLFNRFGLSYRFIGYSEGQTRPFFICGKK